MSYEYSEDRLIEQASEDALKDLGWEVKTAWRKETFALSEDDREHALLGRMTKSEVILVRELKKALRRLNPELPETVYDDAIEQLTQKYADMLLPAINKLKHKLLTDGVPVNFQNEDGETVSLKLKVFDFENPTANDFLAVRQFEVVSETYNRRPDIIGFVNGIPLVFLSLKHMVWSFAMHMMII